MEAVDWTALSVLTLVVLGAVGYLARDTHRQIDRLEARMVAGFAAIDRRLDALEERYIRHLEAHATH